MKDYRVTREARERVYSFCTMSNLSLKPIDSFFGSYFLRCASISLSSFALIVRFKDRGSLLFAPSVIPRVPLPVPCTWFILPLPFSRILDSLSSVVVCTTVVLSLCPVSLESIDFCVFWNEENKWYMYYSIKLKKKIKLLLNKTDNNTYMYHY